MSKGNSNTFLYVGGALVAAYLFWPKASTALTTATNNSAYGNDPAHAPVTSYAQAVAENPNIANPGYTLTDLEAQTLLNNYLDLRQGLKTGGWNSNILQAARDWWKIYGVAEKRVFVPLVTPSNTPYVPAQSNSNSSGGGSTITDVLSIATGIISLLGVNDEKLNDREVELVFNGAAVLNDILPMYYGVPGTTAYQVEDKLTGLLKQYI